MWNIQPSPFGRLVNGLLRSTQCTWYLPDDVGEQAYDLAYPWNVQPFDGDNSQAVPRIFEWIYTELEEEVEEFRSDSESETSSSSERESRSRSPSNNSVVSVDLFTTGKDDIILEGELYKFKPGISQNFIPRYVQIS